MIFIRIFGIHGFYATATLLNMSLSPAIYMGLTDAADGGCRGGLDFASMYAIRSVGQYDVTFQAYRLSGADRRPLLMTTGTSTARVWTLNPSIDNAVKGGHMLNATEYLLLLPRKVNALSQSARYHIRNIGKIRRFPRKLSMPSLRLAWT